MFDASLKDRELSFKSAPGTTMFLHWLVGMVYVFYFASFILLLREVRGQGSWLHVYFHMMVILSIFANKAVNAISHVINLTRKYPTILNEQIVCRHFMKLCRHFLFPSARSRLFLCICSVVRLNWLYGNLVIEHVPNDTSYSAPH